MKRIAILIDESLPDSKLVHAKMYHILATDLLKFNADVTIFVPGRILQKSWIKIKEYEGVTYAEFRCPKIRKKSKVLRLISESLLSPLLFVSLILSRYNQKFTHCINHAPTIFFGAFCIHLRRKGAKIILIQRDFFPKWAIDEGLLRANSVITKYLEIIEKVNYHSAHLVGLQSPRNLEIFAEIFPRYKNKSKVIYNWTHASYQTHDTQLGKEFVGNLGIKNKTIFFYGGNMGHAQDMFALLKLAKKIKIDGNKKFHLLLVGDGHEYNSVQAYIEDQALDNVTLHPAVDQKLYHQLLWCVDVGLITLARSHMTHNFPGKLLGYMEAGLPILGSVNARNDVIELFNEHDAGMISINGDEAQFYRDAETLLGDKKLRARMGDNARKLITSYFSVSSVVKEILAA